MVIAESFTVLRRVKCEEQHVQCWTSVDATLEDLMLKTLKGFAAIMLIDVMFITLE